MDTIKQANIKGKPITHKNLCELADFHKINDFINEATTWGMIESTLGETDLRRAGLLLTVTPIGDAFLKKFRCIVKRNIEDNEA